MIKILKRLHRQGIPLYMCIIFIVMGAVALMLALNILYIYVAGVSLGEKQATEAFSMVSNTTQSNIRQRFDPVLSVVHSASQVPMVRPTDSIGASGSPDSPDSAGSAGPTGQAGPLVWEQAKRAFVPSAIQALRSLPSILAVNYGFSDGSFFSVTTLEDDTVRQNYKAPPGASFALWGIAANSAGVQREFWTFLDSNLHEIQTTQTTPTYDPRTRAWYKAAKASNDLVMTAPYVFTTSRELGVATAMPLRQADGVFSINIMLHGLDTMLQEITFSPSGYFFLLDAQERILGERLPTTSHEKKRGKHWLTPLSDHPDAYVRAANNHMTEHRSAGVPHLIHIDEKAFFISRSDFLLGTQQIALVMLSPVEDFTSLVDIFLRNNLYFALLTLLIIIPTTVWLSTMVGGSFSELLRETMRAGSVTCTPSTPIKSSIKEIRRLSRAVLSMRKSIHRRTQALSEAKNTLEEKVHERTIELHDALVMAEDATEAKTRFLSTMSHEIRTPMNAIVGFSYLLDSHGLSVKQLDYLSKIRVASETLLRIINDILDISKIEADKLDIEHIPFHLNAVLDTVSSIARFSAREKGIEFNVTQNENLPLALMGDPTRLHQVLLNLVNNAIKFTHQGSVCLHVCHRDSATATSSMAELPSAHQNMPDVSVADSPQTDALTLAKNPLANVHRVQLTFSVQDTGIGISPEQLSHLFTPFTQADTTVSRKYGGSGLGLAICKRLVELMGGTITVMSEAGKGSCFTAVLTFEVLPEMPEEEERAPASGWRRGSRLLVVDDNIINREIAGILLEDAGMLVDYAENGQEAVHKVTTEAYDLVFMDMEMPIMNGLEATLCIRALKAAQQDSQYGALTRCDTVPIIAMTANAMMEDRKRCISAGMNGHLSKPIIPDALWGLLGQWLPEKEQSDA